jgi:hypothetical protein
MREGERATGHGIGVVLALVLLAAAVTLSSCGVSVGAVEPAPGPTLLEPDEGWTSAGGTGFLPVPFERLANLHGDGFSPQLISATGSQARVKWLADRAEEPGSQDADSTLTVHVVSRSDPSMRADIEFRGAGGAGFADLPIMIGQRNLYRLSFSANGTYRWCSVLIEVRE